DAAPQGIDLLRVAVSAAASIGDLPVQAGLQTTVMNGTTTVPLPIAASAHFASITILAVRSRPDIALEIKAPDGTTLASSTGAGSSTLSAYSLIRTLNAPPAGEYQVVG